MQNFTYSYKKGVKIICVSNANSTEQKKWNIRINCYGCIFAATATLLTFNIDCSANRKLEEHVLRSSKTSFYPILITRTLQK
jgi:hypothetical protein